MSEALCVDLLVRGQPQAFVGSHCRTSLPSWLFATFAGRQQVAGCGIYKAVPSVVSLLQTFSVSHTAQVIPPPAVHMLHQHLNQPACLRRLQQLSAKSWLWHMRLSAKEILRHHTLHTSSLRSTSLHMNSCQMQSYSTRGVCRLRLSIAGQKDRLLHTQT